MLIILVIGLKILPLITISYDYTSMTKSLKIAIPLELVEFLAANYFTRLLVEHLLVKDSLPKTFSKEVSRS